MGAGLPWATAPLPCYQQLLGSSAGRLGASTTGPSEPAQLLLCHTESAEQGRRLCLCLRRAPRHWHVVTRSSGSAGSIFFHFNICSVPIEKKKIFYHSEQTEQKASHSFSKRAFFYCGTEIQEASESCSFLRWFPSRRLINLSFVLAGVSGAFGMAVTSQDRFAGMGDLVCC